MEIDLLPREKGRPGRRRTTTASAWIARRHAGGNWHSHVYAGSGKVHVLSTGTADAARALDFSRVHLLQQLKLKPAATTSDDRQLELRPSAHVDAPAHG